MKVRTDLAVNSGVGFADRFYGERGFSYRNGMAGRGYGAGTDGFMAEYPVRMEIGIMGHCVHGMGGRCMLSKIQCYQDGQNTYQPNMMLDDFRIIARQCRGKTRQFVLGGRGDPDQHEKFEEILKICRGNEIIPYLASSGFGFNMRIVELCREYCGAAAVSWYRSPYTLRALEMLLKAKVKTNIHYVLSSRTIKEAILRLKKDDFPRGISSVVFLLHKPVGFGDKNDVLSYDDERVKIFFDLIEGRKHVFKIGFDSCMVPGVLNFTRKVSLKSMDACEGGRWSAYITPDMQMLPCSFDSGEMRWSVDLRRHSIKEAWDSHSFEAFRNILRSACPECGVREHCLGGCPIRKEIVLCADREEFSLQEF